MSALDGELRDVIARLLEGRAWPATIEQMMFLWDELVSLGLRDIGIPEAAGGSGGELADLVVVVEALAGAAVSVPIVEASVGRWVLAVCGGELADAVSVAVTSREPALEPAGLEVTVPWGRFATVVLVCTATDVRLVSPLGPVSTRENLAAEPFDLWKLPPGGLLDATVLPVPVTAVRRRLALLRSAGLLGAARGALSLTSSYVRQRHQFGAPLVDIPAVASSLAQMRVQIVQAEAAVARATAALAADPSRPSGDDGPRDESAAAVSLWACAAAATEVARLAHQLHGAIGVTSEYPLHRLTRRIWAWRDFPRTSHEVAVALGSAALEAGEMPTWTTLTAWHPINRGGQADHLTGGE